MPHVHRPGLTVFLGFDPLCINGNDPTLPEYPFGSLRPLTTFACPLNQGFCFCPLTLQRELPLQGRRHLMSQTKPLFTGSRLQPSQRTECPLTRSFWGQYRLDQKVVCVDFVFVNPFGFSDIHLTLS